MTVRAKFKLVGWKNAVGSRLKDGKWVEGIVASLEFSAVHSEDPNSENRKFWEATPSGKIELNIVNPEALKDFDIGKEYYVDFIPVVAPLLVERVLVEQGQG